MKVTALTERSMRLQPDEGYPILAIKFCRDKRERK
jgi:hypothetical protein